MKKIKMPSILRVFLCLTYPLILAVFLLTFSVNVNAETYDNSLPFKFSGVDNYNTFLNDDLLDYIDDQGLPVYDENYVLILRDISYQSANPIGYRFYFDLLPISTFTSYTDDIYNNSVSFSIDTSKTKHRFYVGTLFTWNGSELVPYQYGVAGKSTSFTVNYNMFGRAPTTYTTGESGKKPNWTTTYFYPCYFSKDFYFNNKAVLKFTTGSLVGTGHATAPDPLNDIDPGSHTLPHQVPTLTINNYTWTTAPTPDLTTLENAVNSIFGVLSWLSSNLSGALNNLLGNLSNIGNYIGSTIQYYGGLIYNAIKNGIQNFYDNMVSLFEPMAEVLNKVGVIAATIVALGTDQNGVFSIPTLVGALFVPSSTNIIDLMVSHDEFSVIPFIQAVGIKGQYIFNQLTSITPSHTFHVPSCYFHGIEIGNFDIDFSWYDPFKIYVDVILNGFLILGYIIWLFVTFKDHLRGTFITGVDEPHIIGSNNRINGG